MGDGGIDGRLVPPIGISLDGPAGGKELLAVDRADVEAYARDLEQAGRGRSTVARRLATLAGFYRYAVEEAALPRSPVAHVCRPSVARFLAAAETATTGDHALACLLMLNGLRVSEACLADVADLGTERAHRVLAVVGKGGARVIVPSTRAARMSVTASGSSGESSGQDVHVSCRQSLNASGSLLFIGRQTDDFGKATSEVQCLA